MSYELLSQVNLTVAEQQSYLRHVRKAVSALGFDEKDVITEDTAYEKFLKKVAKRPLLEMNRTLGMSSTSGDVGAASGRAAERDWVRTMANDQATRQPKGQQAGPRTLGLDTPKARPQAGHLVLTPKGIGTILAVGDSGKVMIRDKSGAEFVVNPNELSDPKQAGGKTVWMIRK